MAGSFRQTAQKQVTDISTFLKEAASGGGIAYRAERGKQHRLYVPTQKLEVEVEEDGQVVKKVVETMLAMKGNVHEWNDSAGKYNATVCLDGVVLKDDNGVLVNNGKCPICERVGSSWDIYNYRMTAEEELCQLAGDARKKHLEKAKQGFLDELKAKKAKPYLYILVTLFKTNEDGSPMLSKDKGLPIYELKVMKLSSSRIEKIEKQLKNSGSEMAGSEIIFEYPDVDEPKQLVGQSTISLCFSEQMKFISKYPGLLDEINADVAKFSWDGIEDSFREWKGMTTAAAEDTVNKAFAKWDEYQKEKEINPNAKYMEYAYSLPQSQPSLVSPSAINSMQPTIPGMPQAQPVIPAVPQVAQPVPQVAQPQEQVAQPVEQTVAQEQVAQPQVAQPQGQPVVAATANELLGGGAPAFRV